MLLDNKTQIENDYPYKVSDFLKKYIKNGKLDIVTGFFSVNALTLLYEEMSQIEKFRLILGRLTKTEESVDKVVDLLADNLSIDNALALSHSARKAVAFLQQQKVQVKTIERNFCHAKSYIYSDTDKRDNFFIIGSSNLTDAGLGMRESSNIELNIAKHDYEDEFRNLCQWFFDKWDHVAQDKIVLPDKRKVVVKEHIVELIQHLYKEYTPKDLYYKVLYERFKDDFLTYAKDTELKNDIAHLEATTLYQTLYSYQQKGVMSLIKMLQNHNGAILADAVGLGKTWTALAVMKYFDLKGYKVLLFCPKKLRHNWEQYQSGHGSRFENDELVYFVRNHTDLQDERLDTNPEYAGLNAFTLKRIREARKLLIVIDESHNLRNDKSLRYKYLIENILFSGRKNRDIKVLQLSATPINNGLIDVRNQFKLMVRGQDDGFNDTCFGIHSLMVAFQSAQKKFTEWIKKPDRKIADFIGALDHSFFQLADALIVSRTRKLIENEFGAMRFPQKEKPVNEFITPQNIGNLKSFDDILDAIKINMTAYRPSEYIRERKHADSILEDDRAREKFLVKMMYILLIKRLESSWFSFKNTAGKILEHHMNVLEKVKNFEAAKLNNKQDVVITEDFNDDEQDELQDSAAEMGISDEFKLGVKNPVKLSEITALQGFKKDLETDIRKLQKLMLNLEAFEKRFNENSWLTNDLKLERLVEILTEKQQQENHKTLIFTVYTDTARFLYNELRKRRFQRLAYVSGSQSETTDGYAGKNFEPILEKFAPYTKLYNEKDWTDLYENNLDRETFFADGKWSVPYEKWSELVEKYDRQTWNKISHPIDILIATDCLSEGQNLQDSDLIINYDIHWNPVRLIQRMGRIDRIGSPNKTIRGVNFWPAKDYDDYLNLKSRVENRMAIMTVVGTEMDENLTPELQKMVEDNPLFSKQTEKMLEQMQLTWDDIEAGANTFGFDNLSLEQFRQELFELFKQQEEFFKKIPNGVYTGFRLFNELFQPWKGNENSLVAVLGYPRKKDESDKEHIYSEIRLLHTSYRDGIPNVSFLKSDMEILALLRHHKTSDRFVPVDIENGNKDALHHLSKAIDDWLRAQAMPTAINEIQNLFSAHSLHQTLSPEQQKTEAKFRAENFDLINWFIVSK